MWQKMTRVEMQSRFSWDGGQRRSYWKFRRQPCATLECTFQAEADLGLGQNSPRTEGWPRWLECAVDTGYVWHERSLERCKAWRRQGFCESFQHKHHCLNESMGLTCCQGWPSLGVRNPIVRGGWLRPTVRNHPAVSDDCGKDLHCLAHHSPVYTQGWLCPSPVHLLKPWVSPARACLCRAVAAEGEVVDKGMQLSAVADWAALDRIRSNRGFWRRNGQRKWQRKEGGAVLGHPLTSFVMLGKPCISFFTKQCLTMTLVSTQIWWTEDYSPWNCKELNLTEWPTHTHTGGNEKMDSENKLLLPYSS